MVPPVGPYGKRLARRSRREVSPAQDGPSVTVSWRVGATPDLPWVKGAIGEGGAEG